jgi:hypothetical protein
VRFGTRCGRWAQTCRPLGLPRRAFAESHECRLVGGNRQINGGRGRDGRRTFVEVVEAKGRVYERSRSASFLYD